MSCRKTTGVTFNLVPVAITAIGNQRTTCVPQIGHNTPAYVAAHRRTAAGNQRTTYFPQIAHYTPAFVAARRRRSLFTPTGRSSSKSQNWITHRPAALCSCHSLNPLHASVSKQGPSSSPDFSAEIPPAEPVVTTNIDIKVNRGFDSCRTHFLCEKKKKKKKEEAIPQGKIGLCGERKLNLLSIKMMLRGSLTSDKNK